MTSPTPDPSSLAHEKRIFVAGAGTFGMYVLIASLGMIFLSTMVAYAIFRVTGKADLPKGFPSLPGGLWLSTVVLLVSSGTMHYAFKSIQNGWERGLRIGLVLTFLLGLLFLGLQVGNWLDLYRLLPAAGDMRFTDEKQGHFVGQYKTFFYIFFYLLTALHAAHVIGGLLPMLNVTAKAFRGRYSQNYFPGVRYATIYWHFLDVIWLVMFAVLLLASSTRHPAGATPF